MTPVIQDVDPLLGSIRRRSAEGVRSGEVRTRAMSTRASGGCSVSYSYLPRSTNSMPAARCSGSSQVCPNTRQVPAASRDATRMRRMSPERIKSRVESGAEWVAQHNGLIAVRTCGNHADRHGDQPLQPLEVFARIQRQRIVIRDSHGGLLPARYLLVNRLHPGIAVDTQGRLGDHLTVDAVPNSHPDGIESIQDVELGDTQARNTRVNDRTAQRHRVEPSRSGGAGR